MLSVTAVSSSQLSVSRISAELVAGIMSRVKRPAHMSLQGDSFHVVAIVARLLWAHKLKIRQKTQKMLKIVQIQ